MEFDDDTLEKLRVKYIEKIKGVLAEVSADRKKRLSHLPLNEMQHDLELCKQGLLANEEEEEIMLEELQRQAREQAQRGPGAIPGPGLPSGPGQLPPGPGQLPPGPGLPPGPPGQPQPPQPATQPATQPASQPTEEPDDEEEDYPGQEPLDDSDEGTPSAPPPSSPPASLRPRKHPPITQQQLTNILRRYFGLVVNYYSLPSDLALFMGLCHMLEAELKERKKEENKEGLWGTIARVLGGSQGKSDDVNKKEGEKEKEKEEGTGEEKKEEGSIADKLASLFSWGKKQ